MDSAKLLMVEARNAGCDIVKFQTLDAGTVADDDPEREWFKKIALDRERIQYLIAAAEEIGISILFTPENCKTAQWLLDFGLRDIKIGSSLAVDQELLGFANNYFDRIFLSTGMCSLDEINAIVAQLAKVRDLSILHCISEYPTGPLLEQVGLKALSPEDVRLNMMRMLMALFPQHTIGYSDHTAGILAPVAAVAMGARVIEKHITLDRQTPIEHFLTGKEYLGTDHVLSIEPEELREMVRQIREVELMTGPWRWERSRGEIILREFLRERFS
ncbi:MAG: N-acetylneuraminate synthase family protein [Proteobacteria bacterium]|nr:N-acetylneuraminate synthase family protein [Pseudomonadota bacterium]